MNDVILNKIASIERCVIRIKEEYNGHEEEFATNFTKQDSIILNLQRACETTIDLALHIIKIKKLGLPSSSRDALEILANNHLISKALCGKLKLMVGFRNIAVHDYVSLELDIIESIINNGVADFLEYTKTIMKLK